MTEKRFTYVKNNSITQYQSLPIQEIGKSKALHCQGVVDKLNKLSEENEQLKKELKDYHNAFDCSQCRYQNYDWFDDGDEFEVCDKGNNEAQMEYHSCKDWEEL